MLRYNVGYKIRHKKSGMFAAVPERWRDGTPGICEDVWLTKIGKMYSTLAGAKTKLASIALKRQGLSALDRVRTETTIEDYEQNRDLIKDFEIVKYKLEEVGVVNE